MSSANTDTEKNDIIIVDDLDATQPMLFGSSTPIRRFSSASNVNLSPVEYGDIDLTNDSDASPQQKISPPNKRLCNQTSFERRRCESFPSNRERNLDFDVDDSNQTMNSTENQSVHIAESSQISGNSFEDHTTPSDPQTVHLLKKEAVKSFEDIAKLMAFDVAKYEDKVLKTVPQTCPDGLRFASYVVDLTKLGHPDDISKDSYGKWGQASGAANYYSINHQLLEVEKLNKGKKKIPEGENFDLLIRRRYYTHAVAKEFKKCIFTGHFNSGNFEILEPRWAVVTYEWLIFLLLGNVY